MFNRLKCVNCGKRYVDWITLTFGECPKCKTICIIGWHIVDKELSQDSVNSKR